MGSEPAFLDTSGWLALLNGSDSMHSAAVAIWREFGRAGVPIILSDWVVAETGNGLARTRGRTQFARAVQLIVASSRSEIVCVDQVLALRSLELYTSRRDKVWGLIDCASFVIMQDRGIVRAFTSDRHFEQAGFKCLLPGP